MSMAMALQGVRDRLRGENDWSVHQCGIQQDGVPPAIARNFYVAIDETSVSSAKETNYYLGEDFAISVYINRSVTWLPKDMQGNALLKDDPYLAGIATLDDLERRVIAKLHQKWELTNLINEAWDLPSTAHGDVFIGSLSFLGRSKTRDIAVTDVSPEMAFKQRELRFRGLKRNQYTSTAG